VIFLFKRADESPAFLRRAELKLCRTPFFAACAAGQLKVAKWLYKSGAAGDVQRPSRRGTSPLAAACRDGHEELVRWLLVVVSESHCSEPNLDGVTPMHWAAEAGSVACLDLLFAAGAGRDVRALDEEGFSPLRRAARCGHVPSVQWLLMRGAVLGPPRHVARTARASPATARAEVEAEADVDHAVYLEATDSAHGLGPRVVQWAKAAVGELEDEAARLGSARASHQPSRLAARMASPHKRDSGRPPPRARKAPPRRWDGDVAYTEAEFFAYYGTAAAWAAAAPVEEDPTSEGSGAGPAVSPLRRAYSAGTMAVYFDFHGNHAGNVNEEEEENDGGGGVGQRAVSGRSWEEQEERRWDGGQRHTKAEFLAYYGDLVAWGAAEPAGLLSGAAQHASQHGGAPLEPFAVTESARPLVALETPGDRLRNLRAFVEHESYIMT